MFDYSMAHNLLNAGLVFSTGALGVTLASTMFKFTSSVGQEWDRALKKINKNIYNKDGQIFRLTKIRRIGDNYTAKCIIPSNLSFKQLEDIKPVLEDSLGAVIQLDYGNFNKFININIITSKPNLDFKPVECPCDKLFLVYKADGKPFLIDINKNPHNLFWGMIGTGKATALFMAITNLLANKDNKFELWFAQIVNRETSLFKDCKNVKMMANSLEETKIMLERLVGIADRRGLAYEKTNCRNIAQYNKYNTRKHNRIYLILEEFSFLRSSDNDKKETIYKIDTGKIKPSKSLQDALLHMLQGKNEFKMIGNQKVIYETILKKTKKNINSGEYQVFIIGGGSGTGKSVLAINLLVNLIKCEYACNYVTKNSAPRDVYHKTLKGEYKKKYIENLFK